MVTVAALFGEAEALAMKGEHRAALAKYDAALGQDWKAAKVHAYKALSLISLRQFEEAERSIGEALKLNAKEYTYHEIAGQLKLAQGKIAEGKALYEKAAGMSPANAGAVYTDLAAVLGARKDEKLNGEIVAALEKAASATPPSMEALFALGQTYVSAGRAEGKTYLQRYLAEAAKLPEAKRDQAKVRLAKQMIRALEAVKGAP
jgi:tetratricopeptide (TPR) repeat protein